MICPRCKSDVNRRFSKMFDIIICNKCSLNIIIDNQNIILQYTLDMHIDNNKYYLIWLENNGFRLYRTCSMSGFTLILNSKNIPFDITENQIKLMVTFS